MQINHKDHLKIVIDVKKYVLKNSNVVYYVIDHFVKIVDSIIK